MKALERIFLYSVFAILVFYVFLVNNKVESQVAIQEEIRAKRIAIVNDAGQEVVELWTDVENNEVISIYNKDGNTVAGVRVNKDGDGVLEIYNKEGAFVAGMGTNEEGDGTIGIYNKTGTLVAVMGVDKNNNGRMICLDKDGKVIGCGGVVTPVTDEAKIKMVINEYVLAINDQNK